MLCAGTYARRTYGFARCLAGGALGQQLRPSITLNFGPRHRNAHVELARKNRRAQKSRENFWFFWQKSVRLWAKEAIAHSPP